jgi:hypothetical protein
MTIGSESLSVLQCLQRSATKVMKHQVSMGSLQPQLRDIHLGENLKFVLNVCCYGVDNGSSHI